MSVKPVDIEEVIWYPQGLGNGERPSHTIRMEVVTVDQHDRPVGPTVRMRIDEGPWIWGMEKVLPDMNRLIRDHAIAVGETPPPRDQPWPPKRLMAGAA